MLFDMKFSFMQEDVADEAELGSMYRPNFDDKNGRSVIAMSPPRKVSSENRFQLISILFNLMSGETVIVLSYSATGMKWKNLLRHTLWQAFSLLLEKTHLTL